MAQGRNNISQRISIEGAIDVIRALKDMGEAGEKAIKQIQEAVNASTGTTSSLGAITDNVRAHFAAVRAQIEPVKEKLGELHEAGRKFGESVRETADRIIPHFREVAALAFAGSVAGIVELLKSTADYSQSIKKVSEELGVSVGQYQELQFVIRSMGLEQERFISTFTRLARSVGEAVIQSREHIRGLAGDLVGQLPVNNIVLGDAKKRAEEVGKYLKDGVIVGIPGLNDALKKMRDVTIKAFQETHQDISQVPSPTIYLQQAQKLINEISPAASKFRTELQRFTGVSVPIKEVSEAFDRVKAAGTDMDVLFNKLGVSFETTTGEARPLTSVFEEVGKSLASMENAGERAFTAQIIFNRGFKEILPAFSNGGFEIKKLREEWDKLHIALTDVEVESGSKMFGAFARLGIALENLKSSLVLVFSPEVVSIIDAMLVAIQNNAQGILTWARNLREELLPGVQELVAYIKGDLANPNIKVQWVRSLIDGFNDIHRAISLVVSILREFVSILDGVAEVINSVFGTKFTGAQLAATLAILHLIGAFGLLRNAIALIGPAIAVADAAISLFITRPLAGLIALAGRFGVIQAGIAALGTAWAAFSELFAVGRVAAMFAPLLAFLGPIGIVAVAIIAIGSAVLTLTGSWDKFFAFMARGFENLVGTVKAFIDMVVSAAQALGRLFGQSTGQTGEGQQPGPSPAALQSGGGSVSGSGLGDHVHALLEPGEFVVKRATVNQLGTGFMNALNQGLIGRFSLGGIVESLRRTAPEPLRMATGGLVPAWADASKTFHLSIEGRTFKGLSAPADVHDNLLQFARTSSLVSTGKKPSWYGS